MILWNATGRSSWLVRRMAKTTQRVTAVGLSKALQSTLEDYSFDVLEGIDGAGYRAMQNLVRLTKATAPVGYREQFRRSIAWKEINKSKGKFAGKTFVWYVKPPDHRLTHLLVHGHATKDGGRTKGNPFLENALEQVEKEYIKDVEDALKW